ncbi:hypothetical protein NDU88_004403 [Pleurodeles waltl]|uniref:Uncharacterized protein n=1 Tax=Pleurodeles waltl TaxID=8319 RepID=A0AAV7MUG6_PLEWA|nr:hypothetical protein NDU88_004403 [Pleurodeles waltl]
MVKRRVSKAEDEHILIAGTQKHLEKTLSKLQGKAKDLEARSTFVRGELITPLQLLLESRPVRVLQGCSITTIAVLRRSRELQTLYYEGSELFIFPVFTSHIQEGEETVSTCPT